MKTNYYTLPAGYLRRYIPPIAVTILLLSLSLSQTFAQGGRRGDRNGGNIETGRHSTNREQTARNNENITIRDEGGNGNNRGDRNVQITRPPRNNDQRVNNGRNDNAINQGRNHDRDQNSRVTTGPNRPNNNDRMNNNDRVNNNNRPSNWNNDNDRNRNHDRDRDHDRYRNNNYATSSRPAYRPDYGYNRRPTYDRYNPCWRYGYLPRRNSYYSSLPGTYININFGGIGYRYWDGVFYRPHNNLFMVIAPPVGIFINLLPPGHRRIYVRNIPYYYYNGTYYSNYESRYRVVSPPLGAVVESLPAGYETLVINGETFYVADGAQYKPAIQSNGEIWYEVIKAN